MRHYVILLLSASLVLAGCSQSRSFAELNHIMTIGDQTIPVYLADTDRERSIGLGNTTLQPNQGMAFIWPVAAQQTFWMKDVEYPIDIVWVQNEEVLGYVTAQPEAPGTPQSDYQLYKSPAKVDMVIELSAGSVAELGLEIGDKLTLDAD